MKAKEAASRTSLEAASAVKMGELTHLAIPHSLFLVIH